MPKEFCPFTSEKPAVPHQVYKFDRLVLCLPTHSRSFYLDSIIFKRKISEPNGSQQTTFPFNVLQTILKPSLSRYSIVVEDTHVFRLKTGCEGETGNDAKVVVTYDLMNLVSILEFEKMSPIPNAETFGRLIVPEYYFTRFHGL